MSAVGKQVVLRRRTDRGGQAGAKFLPQEPNHLVHALEREAPPAELANDPHGDEFIPVVDAAEPLAAGRHDAPFLPPFQVAGPGSWPREHVVGAYAVLDFVVVFPTTK